MGRIGRAHGVRGQVRIKAFTDDPAAIGDYGPLFDKAGRRFEIASVRPSKDVVVATLKGVTDRDTAEALNGTDLYIDRDQLPPEDDDETFYHADLVGLEARDVDDGPVGRVIAVHDFGAGDMLEIAPNSGAKSVMVPFTREAVPEVRIADGFVTVGGFAAFAETGSPDEGED
ncbi:MAG: ribosome maturation factor RimM [Rhodobiaceae bacterium]|nr:ribosome maturation factor RimM [Rhodobiaceae bacterium]